MLYINFLVIKKFKLIFFFRYFVQFLVDYQRDFLLIGERNGGKSMMLADLIKKKLERGTSDGVFMQVSKGISHKQV